MRILLVYATTEGQTAKIAGYARDRLEAEGHAMTLSEAAAAPDPSAFDAVILAGSLHAGSYQPGLVAYARTHAAALAGVANAFVSVSLSAAGHEASDWLGLDRCLRQFTAVSGWAPQAVHQAAGALRFSKYGWLTRFFMRRIAKARGSDPRRDSEFTDWQALGGFLSAFAAGRAGSAAEIAARRAV